MTGRRDAAGAAPTRLVISQPTRTSATNRRSSSSSPSRLNGGVYTPPFNREDDEDELRRFVADVRVGWLITSRVGAAPAASLLPVIWISGTVVAHFAKANPHW